MKKSKKKCPNCNSSRTILTKYTLKCLKCGFVNDKTKSAQIITYGK